MISGIVHYLIYSFETISIGVLLKLDILCTKLKLKTATTDPNPSAPALQHHPAPHPSILSSYKSLTVEITTANEKWQFLDTAVEWILFVRQSSAYLQIVVQRAKRNDKWRRELIRCAPACLSVHPRGRTGIKGRCKKMFRAGRNVFARDIWRGLDVWISWELRWKLRRKGELSVFVPGSGGFLANSWICVLPVVDPGITGLENLSGKSLQVNGEKVIYYWS